MTKRIRITDRRNYELIDGYKKKKGMERCPVCGCFSVLGSSTFDGGRKKLCIICGKRFY